MRLFLCAFYVLFILFLYLCEDQFLDGSNDIKIFITGRR